MTTKRKVRADFDKSQSITVNVKGYSEDIKKQVQQAFFDVGIKWVYGGETYGLLKESFYTNVTSEDDVTSSLMWVDRENLCSIVDPITPKEFFAMVYEDEPQGHPHAELIMQYAEDAKTHAEPWKLWQATHADHPWTDLERNPLWCVFNLYRRKPKTHLVHGVEVPDLRIKPSRGENYYYPLPTSPNLVRQTIFIPGDDGDKYILRNNLCYEYTEAGKQAAILHAKTMLGIA